MTDLASLDGQAVDVLILGAGINGAGLFRDLCEQGLTCVLSDKGDFGGGTSAAPSRLIHGGLKYLETGEFRLVAQSTLERNLLLKNAPHLVHPLPTLIPIFSWTRGIGAALRTLLGSTSAPRSRGALLVKIGLALYDFYGSRHRVMPRHGLALRRRALADLPGLTPRIVAAGTYYDARVTAPERLVWELVQDGLAASPGSAAATYTSVTRQGAAITLAGARTATIHPRIVVNAAGPWIDRVNEALGVPTKLIGGTKGSHILLDHPELVRRLAGRMVYFEADDGRICLVYDYLGKALVGSTDIPARDPETVRCDEDETAYFLQAMRDLFPGLTFEADRIVYAYAGIRPLPNSEGVAPGLISRDHSAPVLEPDATRPWPILSLVGGKWTTFRGFAAEVTDTILARLGRDRRVSTETLPIGGGRDHPADPAPWIAEVSRSTGLPKDRIETLLKRYGTTARHVAAHEAAFGPAPLPGAPGYSLAEIDRIARCETVTHLADIVLRRTTLAITGSLTAEGLQAIAATAATALGWDVPRRDAEYHGTAVMLAERHAVTLRNAS